MLWPEHNGIIRDQCLKNYFAGLARNYKCVCVCVCVCVHVGVGVHVCGGGTSLFKDYVNQYLPVVVPEQYFTTVGWNSD